MLLTGEVDTALRVIELARGGGAGRTSDRGGRRGLARDDPQAAQLLKCVEDRGGAAHKTVLHHQGLQLGTPCRKQDSSREGNNHPVTWNNNSKEQRRNRGYQYNKSRYLLFTKIKTYG